MSQTHTYQAIITFSLPQQSQSATVQIVLHPSDPVGELPTAKKLRDCTLADLAAYAQTLEAELWDTYEQIKLVEIPQQPDLQMEIKLFNSDGQELTGWDGLLDYVIAQPVATEPETNKEPLTSSAPTPPTETTPPPPSEKQVTPEPVDAHSQINVAPSEPIHEEREAKPDTKPVIPPHIRILGKRRPLGHPTWTAVDILINEPAFRDAQAHALSSMDREVAGMLIGPRPEKQPDKRYVVHITDIIIAKHTKMQGASVTYTPESWRYVNDKLREKYPEEEAVIVGWYHTHPGFGIFLSGMDQFIHQNFFTQIWHVALVLDPRAKTSGFFCWDRPKTKVERYDFPWPEWASHSW